MGTHPIFESDFDCLTDMLNGAPVTRNLLIGLGVSTLAAIQFKNGTFLRKILGNFTFLSGNHLFEGAIGLYQMSQVERIIGSSILFTRLFSTTFLLSMSLKFWYFPYSRHFCNWSCLPVSSNSAGN